MRVFVYASTALIRSAWSALLAGQPEIVVAGAGADPAALASVVTESEPTAVLVDAPGHDPDLVRRLRAAAPACGLLVLLSAYELSVIIELLQAGATGVISRDEPVGDLSRAVIAAGRGEVVLPPAIAGRALSVLARGGGQAGSGLVEPLSEREMEVLRLLARGSTNKDIAQALMLSVRTVEAHLRSVYGKLGARSRTEAVLWAVRHGYVSPE